jgi:lipid II:glycine glycyltransferase (peptidoglycan interpeptide bridge formation enzyme)
MQVLDGGLFQSEAWKGFQEFLGRRTFTGPHFFGTTEMARFLGKLGYVPRGPVSIEAASAVGQVAQKEGLSALRIEPQTKEVFEALSKTYTVVKAPFDVQPREFLLMDIAPTEEELLKAMKSKWRYNIRLAEKKNVEVSATRDPQDIAAFLDLMQQTAARKSIHFHKKAYYAKFLEFFAEDVCQLFVAKQNGVVLAGSLLVVYGNTAYYLHGGSSDAGRNAMAPHLLQWRQIQCAKALGCTQYDFGGVAIVHQPKNKDWSGITRFKQGFAPTTKSTLLPGAYDIIFAPGRYRVYRAALWVRQHVLFFL